MNIVWFKRDLRIADNVALVEAAQHGPVLPLYILEPKLWKEPDVSHRQYQFLTECLDELNKNLNLLGHSLVIKIGETLDVLEKIQSRHTINGLWSHQETWNNWTYTRDKAVKKWLNESNITWHEFTQNGVIRCLKSRDGWAAHWYKEMKKPIRPIPSDLLVIHEPSDEIPSTKKLGIPDDACTSPQKGGRSEGLKLLQSFLYYRGEYYTKEMSSPVTAFESCSRLSTHLAFGTLSIREVFQASEDRNQEIKNMPRGTKGKWPSALRSFSGRLRWHCHFIQKLEDEPRIEFENLHPAYDGLREDEFCEEYFKAWKQGETGYPMVDACMRALKATGWINFRMRAMLMSFASYHLWLHWHKPALYLAQLFTDYEPGIHYSQIQMQSGTTGINSIRIYNPIKQGIDNDPDGSFVRKWIPELTNVNKDFIHTPWKSPFDLNGYPSPLVDEKSARKAAADKIYGLRKNTEHKYIAIKIVKKHASRKRKSVLIEKKKKTKINTQGELLF